MRVTKAGLQVDTILANFVEDQALPGTGVAASSFWQGFADLVEDLAPKNAALLATRADMQAKIDAWHRERAGRPH
ncbi:MAG: malate synthase G, partial [Pseudomonadota bacterium]